MIFLACLSPGHVLKVSNWYHWVNSGTGWVRDWDLLVATNQSLSVGSGRQPAGWLLGLLCAVSQSKQTPAILLHDLYCKYLCQVLMQVVKSYCYSFEIITYFHILKRHHIRAVMISDFHKIHHCKDHKKRLRLLWQLRRIVSDSCDPNIAKSPGAFPSLKVKIHFKKRKKQSFPKFTTYFKPTKRSALVHIFCHLAFQKQHFLGG